MELGEEAPVERPHLGGQGLQALGQHIGALLLVDEDDNWRFDSTVQDLNELVALVVLLHHEDGLLDTFNGFTNGTDVHYGWASKVSPKKQ